MTEIEQLRKRLKEALERGQDGRVAGIRLLLEQTEAAESFSEVEKNGKHYQRRGDGDYPAEAFAYAPNPDKPTTWRVLLWANADGKMTAEQLGRCAAALSTGGFRGEKADIPAADLPAVKAKIRAAYKRVGVKPEEMPESVKETKASVPHPPDGRAPTKQELIETVTAPVTILQEAESRADGKRTMTVECLLGCADIPTANGRIYPRSLFEKFVKLENEGAPEAKRWLGEMDHPADGRPRLAETLTTTWRALRLEQDGRLYGTTDIIPTARGKDLMEQVRAGVQVQNSSRGWGSEKTETRGGKKVQVVQDDFELGGWDFVLGAAYSPAGITQVLETARGRDESQDEIDMTAEELRAALEEAAKTGGTTAAKLLLETMQQEDKDKKTVTETPPAPVVVTPPPPAPDTKAIIAEVVGAMEARDDKRRADDKALADAVAAKVTEIADWADTPKRLMSEQLRQAATAEQVATIFTQQKAAMESVGLIIAAQMPGTAAATIPGERSSNYSEDRAARYAKGLLERRHMPEGVNEAISLFAEQFEDNGLRYHAEQIDPSDPVAAWLRESSPFPGYHPGNPRHQFEAVLRNVIREHPNSIRYHLRNGLQKQMEYTLKADVVPGEVFMLPLISQVWADLSFLQKLLSVQPMTKSTGRAYFLRYWTDPALQELGQMGTSQVVSDYANNISEQATIPAIKLTIAHGDITMDTKKLKYDWSVEVGQDLQADFGLSAGEALLGAASREIAREIFLYLVNILLNNLDLLGRGPTMGNQNFGLALPAAGFTNLTEWRKEVFQYIAQGDAIVQENSARNTNWIIAGTRASARIMGMENFKLWSGDGQPAQIGIERIGTLEGAPRWDVYSCRDFPTYQMLLGRKGPDWFDAPLVYCPYIPVYVSPVHVTEDLCTVQAMMSRFGTAKVDATLLTTITMLPGVAGVPL